MALDTVSGNSINLGDYRGKVVLINFWATWCPPCVEEIPSLGRLQEEFSKDELVVLSVDVGEPVERVREFLQKVPAAYPVMLDPQGKTVSAWNLRAFPTTFVIDAEGRISLSYFGGLDWDAPDIVEQLRVMVKN
jgi:thiol-disulfide isomerase/thioredoxin